MNAETDRQRWERKYRAGKGPAHFEPQPLLREHRHLLKGGWALEIACGFGGSALYLASLGYRVDAVDISGFGLAQAQQEARRRDLQINFVQADLTQTDWPEYLSEGCFDIILAFAVLHHLPGGERRLRFLQQIRDLLDDKGVFYHSEWQFLNSERLRRRIQP